MNSTMNALKTFTSQLGSGLLGLALATAAFALAPSIYAGEHDHHHHDHAQMSGAGEVSARQASYKLPDVTVMRQDGKKMPLASIVDDGRPVVLNFIYTSCTAICPVTTQTFAQFRDLVGKDRDNINMISVSIDPEHDTPDRLADFAKHFSKTGTWTYLTGSSTGAIAIQKAFESYRGDKMNHAPTTFMRAAPGKPWMRIEGFAQADQLVAQYRKLPKS